MNIALKTRDLIESGLRIEIADVSKSFGSREVLSRLNLTVEAGEFLAIVGRSGCGKSTLLRLLAGLDALDTGRITLGGRDLDGIDPRVRMMFQEPRLLPWQSILHNVLLGLPSGRASDAQDVFARVGLAGREADWPRMLSGGQKQRAALARALIHQPRCLLLDEPLGALDALTRIEMQRLIEDLWLKNRFTAVLVTHDVAEAVTLADRIVLIDRGRVVMDQNVTVPRPRRRGDPRIAEIEGKVLERVLMEEDG